MEKLRDYLAQMLNTYDSIREKGMDLYVARCGHSFDGWSVLFALPDPKREVNDDGSVTLLDSDMEILEPTIHPDFMKRIKNRSVKIYPFNEPEGKEDFTLKTLESVLKGGSPNIFYNIPDID